MSKRLISIGILLAAIAVTLLWRMAGAPEPIYKGKTLTRWLENHVPSSAANPPFGSPGWNEVQEALLHTGTNAVPTLLQMIRAKDLPFKFKVLNLISRCTHLRIHYHSAFSQNEEARYAFEVLGTNAASAMPGLIKVYQDNVSPSSQQCAAQALGNLHSAARAAIPVLLENFTHTNADVRFYAVSAVSEIGGEASVIVPALISALKDSKLGTRWNASVGLSSFYRNAQPAVPALLAAIDDPATSTYQGLKEQYEIALWRIAPETVGKPLIVGDATPMIADGKITQSLDILYKGERRTLIKPGRPVPCLAQFWDSAPQAGLALYRTGGQGKEDEHFLGEFEVFGSTEPADKANISLLCIIANQQIILSARDNNSEAFLGVRRVK